MAGNITYDVDGSSFLVGRDGNSWRRNYHIDSMINGPSIPALIDEAYDLIPDPNTSAPAPIANMFVASSSVDRIWCQDNSGTLWGAEGVITYTTPARYGLLGSIPDSNGPGVTLSTSASVQEIDLYYDVAAAQLVTSYDGATQAHRATGFTMVGTHTFTRIEATYPRSRIDGFVGKLNNAIWNGYGARTILCSSIDVRSDDGGDTFITTYTFDFRPNWDAQLIHDDPFFPGNPLPLSLPNTGTASLDAQVIPDANFASLNIVLPSP